MIFGRPAISTPNTFDLRAVQGAVQAARRRIEILEEAINQLIATVPVTAVIELQAQLELLKLEIASLTPNGPVSIIIDISNFLQFGSFIRQPVPVIGPPTVGQTLFINSFQPRLPTFQALNSVNPAAIDWILPSQIFGA